MWKTKACRLALCVALTGVGTFFYPIVEGNLVLPSLALMSVGAILSCKFLLELLACLCWKPIALGGLSKLALLFGSLWLSASLFELFLNQAGKLRPAGGGSNLTLPEEWKLRPVNIPGTKEAYYWHGKLHVLDKENFRIIGSFPPKQPDVFRVMVLGDSLTYGEGIAQEDTYCRLLERDLGRKYKIEVLNLGRRGDQSTDILKCLQAKLPLLKPDLVVYGVCLNDFLPSQVDQYQNNMVYQINFPWQKDLINRTKIGAFLAKKYDDILMTWGIRADFYRDILRDFQGYQQRFGRDVKDMNDSVTAQGLPPVVTLVLNQYPGDPSGDAISAIAEKYLTAAGMEVVPATYIKALAGKRMDVSPWEGHPNEEANRIFARELQPYIEQTPKLAQFQHAK